MSNSIQDLQYAIDNGIIDFVQVQEQIEMKKRQELLAMHKKPIWQGKGKDKRWKTHLPDHKNTLIAKATRDELEQFLINYYKKELEKPKTFDDMYHHWRTVQDALVSNSTITKYNSDYKRYFQNTEFAKKEIKKITEEDIKVFLVTTVKRLELCQKACKTLYGYTVRVIESARKNHVIEEDPTEFLKASQFYKYCKEKIRPKEACLVSDEELEVLFKRFQLDYQENPSYIPTYAVELATLTGMRVGEIAALRWDAITDNVIIIDKSEKYDRLNKEYIIDDTKNHRARMFPLSDRIKELLHNVKKAELENGYFCEWVFADENGRIHAPVISSCSKNKCRQIGIKEKGIHAYRRTINSKMRCSGVSNVVASSLIGNSPEVNDKYYTFDITDMKEKAKIISNINDKMPVAR